MKNCPNCNNQMSDDAMFCTNCGFSFQNVNPQQQAQQQSQQQSQQPQPNAYQSSYAQPVAPVVDPFDHTAEFDQNDVHENKILALLCYALGIFGVLIALVARISNNSSYLTFHIKQSLKITLLTVILGFASTVLFWTCIVPIAAGVCTTILFVVDIICFVKTCLNKSVEPPIIRSFGFLK